jgi:hypothetical protein
VCDVVGAGVGLGDGAGGVVGGATVGLGVVGFGAGGAVVGLAECVVVAGLGAEFVVWPAAGEVVAPADLRALADADADGEEPLADGDALGPVLGLLDGWVCELDAVPAELLAVLEKSVVRPNAVTALSRVARQVMRDSLRSPESLPAVRLLCLMPATQSAAGLRAHQEGASESLTGLGLPANTGRGPIPLGPAREPDGHPMLVRSSQIAAGLDGSMLACSVTPGRSCPICI